MTSAPEWDTPKSRQKEEKLLNCDSDKPGRGSNNPELFKRHLNMDPFTGGKSLWIELNHA